MSKRRKGQRADIVEGDVGSIFEQRAGLGSQNEELGRRGPGAPADPFVNEIGAAGLMGTRGGRQSHRIADDFLRDRNFANNFMKTKDVFSGKERFNSGRQLGGGAS